MPGHGGKRQGAGRKSQRDEERLSSLFIQAAKEITNTENEDEAKIEIIKRLWESSARGQQFIAEHLFGKPKETVDVSLNKTFPDLSHLSGDELQRLIDESETTD